MGKPWMKRLRNAAVALVATLVAYQTYVLAVAPLVEPKLALREYDPANDEDFRIGKHAVGRWQEILAHYLPQEHWALTGAPQVYEYSPMVLVLDDFHPTERGEIEITKCVLLAFPTPREPGQPPPRDAIIVEAPERVTILFDKLDPGLDISPGKIGKPIAGRFPGELVIRSDMNEPGPQDDLRIVTRDLRFNQAMLHTNAPVDLALGPHRGRGRELEIRFHREQFNSSSKSPVAGVKSLELRREVQLQVDTTALKQSSTLGNTGPLNLTSGGSFYFDLQTFEASFEDDVRAILTRPGLEPDRLLCRRLSVHFGDSRGESAKLQLANEPDPGRAQTKRLSDLQPRLIEAIGSPVRLDSPSRQVAIRGERLVAGLIDQSIRLEGKPAKLAHGLSQAEAPLLQYVPAPAGFEAGLGDLIADGPGWMRITPNSNRPDRVYQARWGRGKNGPAIQLQTDPSGVSVLRVEGRSEVAASGLGNLQTDHMAVRLRRATPDGEEGPAVELGDAAAILPERVDARGNVRFVGREVEGVASDLVAIFRPESGSQPEQTGPRLNRGRQTSQGQQPDRQRFHLETQSIQVGFRLASGRAKPQTLLCDGGVLLREQPRQDGKQAFSIKGHQLRGDRLDRRGGARFTIAGGEQELAQVDARGARIWVRDLHVDQAAGRAWTEGRGDARLVLPERPDATPTGGEATLRWSGGMVFNGQRIALHDDVFAETAGGWLSAQSLTARLTESIDLAGGSFEGPIDIRTIECDGGVTADYRTSDDQGQRSHENFRVKQLAWDRMTDDLVGEGPGSIRSVRLGGSSLLPGKDSAETSTGLKFLRVDFRDGLTGNITDRAVRFRGNVQAVYGPVLSWDHTLPLRSPDGVPPDAVELRCEQLRVHEDPAAAVSRGSSSSAPLGPMELRAEQRVRIEASLGDEGGGLIAEAASASYAQASDRLDLAGDAQQLARLWVRSDATQPYTPTAVGRLTHYPSLGRTKIHDIRGLQYQSKETPLQGSPQRR